MVILLLQESWWNGINAVWGLLLILIMIGGGLIILLSKRREDVQLIETKRADANANLVKARDAEITDLKADNEKVSEELEDVTSEYRAVVSIKLTELVEYWEDKQRNEAKWRRTNRENVILREQLGIGPDEKVVE